MGEGVCVKERERGEREGQREGQRDRGREREGEKEIERETEKRDNKSGTMQINEAPIGHHILGHNMPTGDQ